MRIDELLEYETLREGLVDKIKLALKNRKEATKRDYIYSIQQLLGIINSNHDTSVRLKNDPKLLTLVNQIIHKG